MEEKLVDQNLIFKQWFDVGGESNHLPIFLELQRGLKKLANPFKFCASWLKDEVFIQLLQNSWAPYKFEGGGLAAFNFTHNLSRIKKEVQEWVKEKI